MRLIPDTPMLAWAIRDILRHPLHAAVVFFTLFFLSLMTVLPLLTARGLHHTARALLAHAPDILIRKQTAGGFAPIPEQDGIRIALSIPGVVSAKARIHGSARIGDRPVLVMGCPTGKKAGDHGEIGFPGTVQPGQVILGRDIRLPEGDGLTLASGPVRVELTAAGALPESTAAATRDTAILNPSDARRLLELPEGWATDIALSVFHESEIAAILPELVQAFPFPVRLITRTEILKHYADTFSLRSGLALMMMVPAVLAVAVLVLSVTVSSDIRAHETGLLKALGWRTRDRARVALLQAFAISLPAIGAGLSAAMILMRWPRWNLLGQIMLGWREPLAPIYLSAPDRFLIGLGVGIFILLPFLLAHLWAAIRGAATDPDHLLEGTRGS